MTIRTRLAALFVIAACWSAFASLRLSAAAQEKADEAPVLIPMELLANRPLVRATINGQGPFGFLVVTGAAQTLIDPELGDALKIKRTNNVQSDTVEFAFGAKHTVKGTAVVEDITHYVADFPASLRPRGVISLTLWKDQLVTLDYPRWKVSIESGALPEPDNKTVFALGSSSEFRLPLSVGEQSIECHVDPMFPSDLLVPASLLADQPPRSYRDVGTMKTPEGLRRVRETKLTTTAMLGPFELKTPVVLISEAGETARIGASWLGRFEVTYDVAHARVRLEKSSAVVSHQ